MEFKFRIQCPVCKNFYRCFINDWNGELNPDGSITIVVKPETCGHSFVVYLDAKLNPRSTQVLSDAKISSALIRTDSGNLLQKEKELLERHQVAVSLNDHIKVDETWNEIKRIRKEITRLGID